MRFAKTKFIPVVAFAALGMTACGSDSTGPSNIDQASALQSLALALQTLEIDGTTATLDAGASLAAIAPFLNQITINVGGSSQKMFGLALRETFPAGTCWETIFQDVLPADPSVCTPPPLGLSVILWQSHSASEPPDRILILAADVGTSDFSFDIDSPDLSAAAIYVDGKENLWLSESGTLTSTVAATSQSCDIPLPPYAKSGSCTIANFDEQGSIVMEPFNFDSGTEAGGAAMTLTIPHQTLHGLWLAITEVQPIGLTATRLSPATWAQRLRRR